MPEKLVHSREVVLERQESPTQGAYRATIFVNERARQGPDLSIEGLQTENYMRNPVVLWSHDMSGKTESAGLPIGRTNRMTNTDGKIEVDFEFITDDPFADRVRNAWDKGFLQAASVSWLPLESEQGEDGNQRDIRSDVSVPSDPDAIRQAHSRLMETMLTETVPDADVWGAYRQEEEEEEGDEPEAEEKPEPCWEANEDCVVRAAMKEAEGAEESQEPEVEESSVDAERVLAMAKSINTKLRGGAHV
jgi:hypothetical protein